MNTNDLDNVRLIDVMPTEPPPAAPASKVEKIRNLRDAVVSLKKAEASRETLKASVDQHDQARLEILGKHLPIDLRTGFSTCGLPINDVIELGLNSPLIPRTTVIEVAQSAGLALIPTQYTAGSFWSGAPAQAESFRKLGNLRKLPVWMLAPVTAFDISKFVAEDGWQRDRYGEATYRNKQSEPILPGMSAIILPVLFILRDVISVQKDQQQQLNALRSGVQNLESRMSAVENGLAIERARALAAIAEREHQQQEMRRIALEDPLLLMGAEDASHFIVGPCWGPPLPRRILSCILGLNR